MKTENFENWVSSKTKYYTKYSSYSMAFKKQVLCSPWRRNHGLRRRKKILYFDSFEWLK